ncbi:MAG TPA: hypothetical protein ENN72_04735 [Firmicutes bacterium]|nr:hypothetical protein [Bacillota bacterium]
MEKKTLVIIAEYNPLHKGHLYQIKKAREEIRPDYVVIILSGNFVQRGEPALLNEEKRSQWAIEAGADLVLRNPTAFATASADYFALGAVRVMNEIPGSLVLSFGSEKGKISPLEETARLLSAQEEQYYDFIRESLSDGDSFPRARERFITQTLPELGDVIRSPNNILGIEYIKHAQRILGERCRFHTVLRRGAGYHEESRGAYMSATGIRKSLFANDSSWKKAVPSYVRESLHENYPLGLSRLTTLLKYSLFRDLEKTHQYRDVIEGLENRMIRAAGSSETYEELIRAVATKRYTHTAIKRAFLAIFLGLTKKEFSLMKERNYPYIRILAFNNQGKRLLAQIRKESGTPFIHNDTRYPRNRYFVREETYELFKRIEVKARELYRILSV